MRPALPVVSVVVVTACGSNRTAAGVRLTPDNVVEANLSEAEDLLRGCFRELVLASAVPLQERVAAPPECPPMARYPSRVASCPRSWTPSTVVPGAGYTDLVGTCHLRRRPRPGDLRTPYGHRRPHSR